MAKEKNSEAIDGEVVDVKTRELEKRPDVQLSSFDMASIDIQVATAKKYPRSIGKFKQKAITMATQDLETAESCTYYIPRGNGITGPSVRLAEICASAWGNLRVDARVVGDDEKYVYAEAVSWDLENNAAFRRTIHRRITDKRGKRFNDDMVAVTANAAAAIAKREAVFDIVPRSYIREVQRTAQGVARGDANTLNDRRASAFQYFAKHGVAAEKILKFLGRKKIEDVDLDDVVILRGIHTAINDGEIKAVDAFPEKRTQPDAPSPDEVAGSKATKARKDMANDKPEPEADAEVEAEAVAEVKEEENIEENDLF